MEKNNLTSILSEKMKREEGDVKVLLEGFSNLLREKFEASEMIALPGFGKFIPNKIVEHIETDATTGRRSLVPPCVVLEFEPSTILKTKIAEKGGNNGE